MNGLLRRLTRRRAATADEHPPEAPAASEPVDDATVVSLDETEASSEEERARLEELKRRRRDLPAGLDPEELEGGVEESARRGALRRRIRFLRAAREVLLRDLGGFYYEIHRTARTSPNAGQRSILETKAQRLADIDGELRQLNSRLAEEPDATTLVREPGIGGTCPTCGELHGSEAAWCWHCGTPLTERSRARHQQEIDEAITARQAAAAEAERQRAEAAAQAAAPATAEHAEETTADQKTLAEYTARKRGDEPAAMAAGDGEADGGDATAGGGDGTKGGNDTAGDAKTERIDPVGERRR